MRHQPIALEDMTEKEWETLLFNSKKGLAPVLGWRLNYHTLRSKGSVAGFVDWIIVRERLIAIELKTMKGKPSPAQVEWLDALATAGIETYLFKPCDLEEIATVLTRRTRPDWTPASQWIPGLGRADTTTQGNLLKETT